MCWNITGSDLTQKAFCQIDLEQQTHKCTPQHCTPPPRWWSELQLLIIWMLRGTLSLPHSELCWDTWWHSQVCKNNSQGIYKPEYKLYYFTPLRALSCTCIGSQMFENGFRNQERSNIWSWKPREAFGADEHWWKHLRSPHKPESGSSWSRNRSRQARQWVLRKPAQIR